MRGSSPLYPSGLKRGEDADPGLASSGAWLVVGNWGTVRVLYILLPGYYDAFNLL